MENSNSNENRLCIKCNKKLRAFTSSSRDDWERRKYHLKCYKEKLDEDKHYYYINLKNKY